MAGHALEPDHPQHLLGRGRDRHSSLDHLQHLLGAVLTTLGQRGKLVLDLFEGINEAMMKLVQIVMLTAPFGVLGLVSGRFAAAETSGGLLKMVGGLGLYSFTVVLGLAAHACLLLPLVLWLGARRNAVTYAGGVSSALLSAFATASSSATLPLTMQSCEQNNRVQPRYTRFVLPLGATINMDGTALYEAVAAVFIAQAWGIELEFSQQVIIFLTATIASIGAAGIPEAGTVTMVIVLNAVGLP